MLKVVLASASPRRQELLKLLFSEFLVCPSDADESYANDTPAFEVPVLLSARKAEFVADFQDDALVISADTCVIIEDKILGKPRNYDDAFETLSLLSGKTHYVITGCTLYYGGEYRSFSVKTQVEFYELTKYEIDEYINRNECFDKAGAYGIQGYGSTLVKGIKGDYFNVVGLPVSRLKREIDNFIGGMV